MKDPDERKSGNPYPQIEKMEKITYMYLLFHQISGHMRKNKLDSFFLIFSSLPLFLKWCSESTPARTFDFKKWLLNRALKKIVRYVSAEEMKEELYLTADSVVAYFINATMIF